MNAFALSELQANAILDLRLRQLAKLEEFKLKSEKDELNAERADIEKTLKSKARLKTLIKKELLADAEEYGDPRRSPIELAGEAAAFTEEEMLSNEPITVVLSEKGWVRAAKGHELDPAELNYRGGDRFGHAVRGRTNETLVFLDSSGRSYSMAPHSLPSARGQGEPLTGRLKPPPGARFVGVALGSAESRVLLAGNAGYGFVCALADLVSKNKSGKSVLSVGKDGAALRPVQVPSGEGLKVAAVTSQGRLLVFPLAELPELSRGRGNKLINVPGAAFKSGEESVVAVQVLSAADELLVTAGQRHLRLKAADLAGYEGERARRGRKLPRGFQKVDGLETASR
jgi:topoisomerase IV subunit A